MERFKLARLLDYGGDLTKRWCVEFYFLHPETKQYKKFRQWISCRLLTKQQRYLRARELERSINARLRSGFNPFLTEAAGKTITAAVADVLQRKARITGELRRRDLGVYSRAFMKWLVNTGRGSARPSELPAQVAQEYADYLVSRGLGARTVNNHVNGLRTIFADLLRREYCEHNPFGQVQLLPSREADISFITDSERRTLRAKLAQDHPALYAAAMLVYYCFMRPATIARLQVCDVNLTEGSITVRASRVKNGRNKQFALAGELATALSRLNLDVYPPEFYIFANGTRLQPGPRKNDASVIARSWRQLVKGKYGIKKNMYDLKATGAALAFDAGISARDVQLQLGHHSLEVTQRYLDKVSQKASAAFLEKMPAF